jgi:hypothetical protein
MTKCTDSLIFCATSFTFTKYSNFLFLLTFILPEFFLSHKSALPIVLLSYTFQCPFKLPCLLYMLPISPIIICSTRYYRVMSAVLPSKQSNPVTKANCSSQFVHTVLSSVSRLCSNYYRAKSVCNTEKYWEIYSVSFNGPNIFSKCLIIPTKYSVYIKRDMIVYRYIVLMTSWYCLSKPLPQLTRFLVNFIPSSRAPVCCIAIDCFVKAFAVEHKNLRIINKLLCVQI